MQSLKSAITNVDQYLRNDRHVDVYESFKRICLFVERRKTVRRVRPCNKQSAPCCPVCGSVNVQNRILCTDCLALSAQ